MLDFVLIFLGAIVWGDLSLIGSGISVALGEENIWLDFSACFLGVFAHDLFLFYLGRSDRFKILTFSFFKKKMDTEDSNYFYNFKEDTNKINPLSQSKRKDKNIKVFDCIPLLFLGKFNINSYTSLPILFGKTDIKFTSFIFMYLILDIFYSVSLFLFSHIFIVALPYRGIFLHIPNISAALFSLIAYLVYSTPLWFLRKLFRIPGYGKSG